MLKRLLVLCAAMFSVSVFAVNDDTFALMRQRLRNEVTQGASYNAQDEAVKAHIAKIVSDTRTWQTALAKTPTTFLWQEYDKLKDDNTYTCKHLYYTYQRLHTMSLAWAYPTSELYHNADLLQDLLRSLDFLYDYAFNENTKLIGNFWEWRIGIPDEYAHIVSILYDVLSAEQIARYGKSLSQHVRWFANNGNLTFGNQASICKNLLYMGILTNNQKDIEDALQKVVRAFKDETTLAQRKQAQALFERMILEQGDYHDYNGITRKEGLYADGTFIQHVAIPYIGTYGAEIIDFSAKAARLLKGTGMEIPQAICDMLPVWIEKAYFPAIYKGEMMRMFMGRSTSSSHNPHSSARTVGLNIYESAELIKEHPSYERIVNVCKQMYTENKYYSTPYAGMNPIIDKPRIDALLAAGTETAYTDKFNLVLAAGDRIIHQAERFRLGIAMSSNRIGKYEAFSNNNLKGWYTGDGMTYVYTDTDRSHWKDYFSYVNAYRMPGTTVDKKTRQPQNADIALFDNPTNAQSWVGGVSLQGRYGTAGMSHVGAISDLTARKSWFMFDNEVVCLGAGISMSESREVETIVENRKSTKPLFIGETQCPVVKGKETVWENTSYAYLAETGGYFFPQSTTIQTYLTSNGYTELYLKHGKAPQNKDYAYALLPMLTQDETRRYAAQPDMEILANTDRLQAVTERTLQVTGICFWEAGTIAGISADGEAAVMYRISNDTMYMAVADPTWKRSQITLSISGLYELITSTHADRVKLTTNDNVTALTVNTADHMGQDIELSLKIKQPMSLDKMPADAEIRAYAVYDILGNKLTEGATDSRLATGQLHCFPAGVYLIVYATAVGRIFTEKTVVP